MIAVTPDVRPASSRSARYARCVKLSKKAEWRIHEDVIRGRALDFTRKFLPDGLSLAARLSFLSPDEVRRLSQVQGRTYACMFGLVERFISATMLEQARNHGLGDQNALEALIRFSLEDLKHQELFRHLEQMMAENMPTGYTMTADPNALASAVLGKSAWAVLALTCHIELFVKAHYEQCIEPRQELCPLFKDVFHYHWLDERQHVVLDELEWTAEHEKLSVAERDQAVDDLIALLGAVDGVLAAQSKADAGYFCSIAERSFSAGQTRRIESAVFAAYRWQYIVSGVQHLHFGRLLSSMTTPAQMDRITAALRAVMQA